MAKINNQKKTFSLRLNSTIKAEVKEKASELGISENSLISLAINSYVKSLRTN